MQKLVCKGISAGLITSERLVVVETCDGDFNEFVGISHVDEENGLVDIVVLKQDDTYAFVYIPGTDWTAEIKVLKSLLRQ
jgi:hypothetical protein